jgi:hypothetical protein
MQLSPRRLRFGTSIALALAALAVGIARPRVPTESARRQADEAAARLAVALERDDTTRALSLSYLERARLGLGSPFRLIDEVVHDPRLSDSVRNDVAWSIVGKLFAGDVYQVDPRALDLVSQAGAGGGHLALIEHEIESSDDPRVADAALRTAYALAASAGVTAYTSLSVVAEASAQVRDRELAIRDLHRAIGRARDDEVDLVSEVIHMRTTRELEVEQPLLAALPSRDRDAVISGAPEILERIEAVGVSRDTTAARPSLLDKRAAMILADLARRRPPLAAIRVPVTGRAATLRADTLLPRSTLPVIAAASNEESLVAAYAFADNASHGASSALHRLMVSAGASLRAHAQDRPWFAGGPSPTPGAVIGMFGLKAITFDRDVPREWRPFFTQMIATALEDFERAVPGYEPRGLSFSVEMGALPDSALAMHDPRTHTIRLSVMTPSGTLAHELAHDVDWQAARRLFARTGGYATDRSLRENAFRLTSSVRGLTSARIAGRGRISPHGSSRPAEVFARSVDWFVADALAALGRSNGYLTAIADPQLAGFAAAPADAPSLAAAPALVHTLAEMTYVPDSATREYVRRWSTLDALDPATIVSRTMDAPISLGRSRRMPFGLTKGLVAALATGPLCRVDAMREGTAQDRLLALAIEARARGIVVRRARYAPPGPRAADDLLITMARVAESFARAGLIELPPPPFQPGCE